MFDPSKKNAFIAYIVGRRNQGKSSLLIKMLLHKKLLKGKFDQVIIINPTYNLDTKYHVINFTQVHTTFTIDTLHEIEEAISKQVETNPDYQTLLVFDDCVSSPEFKSNQYDHPLNHFALNGRHLNISMIFLSQRYTGLSQIIRTQLDYLILFNPFNHSEKEAVYEEYGKGVKKDFFNFLDDVFKEPYDFLVVDNKVFRYLKNFCTI
jgi:hypothetical protein